MYHATRQDDKLTSCKQPQEIQTFGRSCLDPCKSHIPPRPPINMYEVTGTSNKQLESLNRLANTQSRVRVNCDRAPQLLKTFPSQSLQVGPDVISVEQHSKNCATNDHALRLLPRPSHPRPSPESKKQNGAPPYPPPPGHCAHIRIAQPACAGAL